MAKNSPYRPHPKWHDYHTRGIYLITLVVKHRDHILSELNMDAKKPGLILTETGKAVVEQWKRTGELQAKYNRKVKMMHCVAMPDHFHGIIFIEEWIDIKLGTIIQAFKSACTSRWRKINGITGQLPTESASGHLSINRRLDYYAALPRINQPLFDPDYDDSILFKRGQLKNMIDYVKDNPRRAILRKMFPDLFRKYLKIEIAGRYYSAYGNIFLLRAPSKEQVYFHRFEQSPENLRKPMKDRIRYEETAAFQQERNELILHAQEDFTVLINPAVSKGEQILRDDCFCLSLRMIHIQSRPMTEFYKPEKQRFDACAAGRLLILAPLELDKMDGYNGVDKSSKYSTFHNINTLAKEITEFYGSAKIIAR